MVTGGNVGAKEEVDQLSKRDFKLDISFIPLKGDVLKIKQGDYECSVMIIDIVHHIVDGKHLRTSLVIESVDVQTVKDSSYTLDNL